MALILSMREVRGISHQSIDTLTNSSGSYNNTNRTSLTKNPSGLGSGNASKAQSRPHSRASNFPTEEYHYTAYKHPHVPSSASATHSHSPSPTPSSIPGAANFPTSLHPQMKKISSGTLSIGAQSRESRASSTANYSASVLSSSVSIVSDLWMKGISSIRFIEYRRDTASEENEENSESCFRQRCWSQI